MYGTLMIPHLSYIDIIIKVMLASSGIRSSTHLSYIDIIPKIMLVSSGKRSSRLDNDSKYQGSRELC